MITNIVVGPFDTNCYFVYKKGLHHVILIDPGGDADKIKEKLLQSNLEVEAILLTHGHGDHIAAIDNFAVPVFIHNCDKDFLKDPHLNLSSIFFKPFQLKTIPSIFQEEDELEFRLSNLKFKILHTPGHTPGSCCFLIDNALFSGDTLFCEGVGRVDLPAGNWHTLKNSIKNKIYSLRPDIKVYPGHGPFTTIKHEKSNNPFV